MDLMNYIQSQESWEFDICPWGSCQYQSAYFTHKVLKQRFPTKNELLFFLQIHGYIKGNPGEVNLERFSERFKKTQEYIKSFDDEDLLIVLDKVNTPRDALVFLKFSANDLWTSVPLLYDLVYPDNDLSVKSSELNAEVGVKLLLLEYDKIIDTTKVSLDFDT